MTVSPYVFFGGDCAAAFQRYQEIFGGQAQVMTFADAPGGAEAMPGAQPTQVMHASLAIGDGLLMGSDDPTSDGGPKRGVAVTYTAPDADTARRIFTALAEGGETQMPFEATFWSKGFGSCVDRFGVPWMVDTADEV